jgi:hypothetical protein
MLFFSFLQVFSLCKPCKRLKDTRDRSVGVSVRGSVDTTPTPVEYIISKGFSGNI